MSEEEKWTRDAQLRESEMSLSRSSFEVLDPHDPVISRLATQLFKTASEYLQGEMTSVQDNYMVFEDVNRITITKYNDLKNLAINLGKVLNGYNDLYAHQIKPLLAQIDAIDEQVSQFEANAYRLDNYTRMLKARFKELEDNLTRALMMRPHPAMAYRFI